jgi:hypothetical protein
LYEVFANDDDAEKLCAEWENDVVSLGAIRAIE